MLKALDAPSPDWMIRFLLQGSARAFRKSSTIRAGSFSGTEQTQVSGVSSAGGAGIFGSTLASGIAVRAGAAGATGAAVVAGFPAGSAAGGSALRAGPEVPGAGRTGAGAAAGLAVLGDSEPTALGPGA